MTDTPDQPQPWKCIDCSFTSKDEAAALAHQKEMKHGLIHNITDGDGKPII